ncbi:MAG TPA: adenylate/guanylate cyclase domain-containing protein [Candidatus Nanoarchaeia archaeon]|nr:adenylate/guanylate cyclase domain-containing protein [Candidatus Nanoarchaeia archaeon]
MPESLSLKSETRTIMFIDIVGYTSATVHLSREQLNYLQEIFDNLALPVFQKYSGTVIKKIGDAFLVTFRNVTDALLCGIELQNTFKSYNQKNKPEHPLNIRIGIHHGEVVLRDKDIYGEAVNLTARLEEIIPSGEIYFTETVYKIMNKNEVSYLFVDDFAPRGIPGTLKVYKIRWKKDGQLILLWQILEVIFFFIFLILLGWLGNYVYRTYF